jgi:PPK2 family polyphosphate:nucleotide phosphotransferase
MKFSRKFMVPAGTTVKLSDYDPRETLGYHKGKKLEVELEQTIQRLDELQYLLYAENKRAVLVVLQGMDTSGKDGTIRHVMTGLNPQGTRVTAFKVPSPEELGHDYLWRVHAAMPSRGDFGIFNRSHYEDVLVVRVHKLAPEAAWMKRYTEINEFEKYLARNDIVPIKFFLHISRAEQKRRLQARLEDRAKQWKISEADFKERKFWNDYVRAYEAVLTKCNTNWSPWHIIPADHKWFRNLAVSNILVEILKSWDMKFPKPQIDISKIRLR